MEENACEESAFLSDGTHEGIDFLVLEHLEGETLAERITRGPSPLDEALRAGIEIADALDKAHRRGIVHRDLEPGNAMLTRRSEAARLRPRAQQWRPISSSTHGAR